MNHTCIMAHAGARDHYQLALAMAEQQLLQQLVTDFYSPDWLNKLFPQKMGSRYMPGLSSRLVHNCMPALGKAVQMKVQKNFQHNQAKDAAISNSAFALAQQHQSHLFLYSYYAAQAFTKAKQQGWEGKRLLFQLHPHPLSIQRLLQEEIALVPSAAASLQYENEMQYNDAYLHLLSGESLLADAVMVASSYTKKTLVENGVAAERITVNPYGIDTEKFLPRNIAPTNNKLRLLFLGSMVQRKGLSYLLESIVQVGVQHVELVLCGRGFIDHALLSRYPSVQYTIKENVSAEALVIEMHQADVFVLPSLTEGFAHVILEAMACGLPIITTTNTCAPDIITEGREGFIIPIRDTEKLAEKLQWGLQNKTTLFDMGQQAAKTAKAFTWQRFRQQAVAFYQAQIH